MLKNIQKKEKNLSDVGISGENIAAKYLKNKGFYILERNYKTKFGEIDIISIAPDNKTLVFVEVKTLRGNNNLINPEDNINYKKIINFKRCAEYYFNNIVSGLEKFKNGYRLDAIAINLEVDGNYKLKHYENIS